MIGNGRNRAKPTRDTKTGVEYRSEYQAGKAVAATFQLDPTNPLIFYKVIQRCPGRFQTKNARGEWVELDDPSASGVTKQ